MSQYFSSENGIALNANWDSLHNMLDICLVYGLSLGTPTSAVKDVLGRVVLTFSAAHKVLLFQNVTLSGFFPAGLNTDYQVIALTTSELTLAPLDKRQITQPTTIGSARLTPIGYDIAFTSATCRVYRAKKPTSSHPFIRVDCATEKGGVTYNSSFARSAMVGLLENMTHIDDVENTHKQIPYNQSNPARNWEITKVSGNTLRGESKWFWATNNLINAGGTFSEGYGVTNGQEFSIAGDADAVLMSIKPSTGVVTFVYGWGGDMSQPSLNGACLLSTCATTLWHTGNDVAPNSRGMPLVNSSNPDALFCNINTLQTLRSKPLVFDYDSGRLNNLSNGYAHNFLFNVGGRLLNPIPKALYMGGDYSVMGSQTTVAVLDGEAIAILKCFTTSGVGGLGYMLGEAL